MNNSIAKNTFVLTICNIVQFIGALVQSVILAHAIHSKYEYGRLQQIFLIGVLTATVGSAIPSAMSFFWGKADHEHRNLSHFFSKFFFTTIIIGVVSSGIIFLGSPLLSDYFSNTLFQDWKLPIFIYFFLKCINNYANGLYLLNNQLQKLLIQNILSFTAIAIWMVYITKIETAVLYIFYGLIVIELIRILFLLKDLRFFFSKSNVFTLPTAREWRYVITLIAMMLLTVFNSQADRFIVSQLLGPAKYSDYSVGTFANPFIGLITGSLMMVLLPLFSELYHKGNFRVIAKLWRKVTVRACVLLLPLIIFTILFGDQIILLIYPPQFILAAKLFQLYNIKYIFTVIIFGSVINAIGQEKWMLINAIVNTITLCLLCIILIPIWDLYGAVIASILSLFAGYALPIWLTKKYLHVTFDKYFPIRFFLKTFCLCLGTAIAVRFLSSYLPSGKYFILLTGPIYIGICYAILIKDKKQYLRKLMVRKKDS
ncbi:polysaccharide biosynthesis C-terminal domain-containing protein [Chitinophaga eiseniae]|uniref:Oligosaccharide flippase family protein n=1 Tax=Chitinophaga eiseniae TaxID=634771 RepID=A0A847SMJ9_9BACT|nr:polysaccharide biosynthesis C-terminal domain-containing protein [Chitinophaga eiseniae]NLR78596.1 oligosaccharide flippase family protein [Chitinophaga eiseniae]